MAAPKGNRFWEARAKHGRNKKFLKPEDIWKQACEYFQWVDDHPLMQPELVKFQGAATVKELPKMRAMTLDGLLMFIDCSESTWRNYRSDENKDFLRVITRIEQIIYQQKFTGAAADMLNPNIIARDLGLADKKELTGKDGAPIRTISTEMTPAEAAQAYADTLNDQE